MLQLRGDAHPGAGRGSAGARRARRPSGAASGTAPPPPGAAGACARRSRGSARRGWRAPRSRRARASRWSTENIIPVVDAELGEERSGGRLISSSKVSRFQGTKPFSRRALARRLAPAPAAARSARLRFSITCSGAWATTLPCSSKPLRPARPAICLNSRTWSSRTFSPSNLESWVKSTVRIGMLTPTPSVSVPQITRRRPCCASCSTSRRYFGSRPGVVEADAVREEAAHVLAVGRVEAELAERLGDALALLAGGDAARWSAPAPARRTRAG